MHDSVKATSKFNQHQQTSKFKNFEEALTELHNLAQKEPISLKTFLSFLAGKGKLILLIFVCLPLGQIPVLSFGSGVFVVYLGIRIAFCSHSIWLPASILQKKVPHSFLKMATRQLLGFLKIMKRWSKPRYVWVSEHTILRKLNGIFIILVGISIILCPLLPFIGYISYLAVFLICIGLLNEDGVYIILGYVVSFFYLFLIFEANRFFSIEKLLHLFSWLFTQLRQLHS